MKEKKVQKKKRQAVELVIHSGKTQAQIARELGVSEYSLTLWKRAELGHLKHFLRGTVERKGPTRAKWEAIGALNFLDLYDIPVMEEGGLYRSP